MKHYMMLFPMGKTKAVTFSYDDAIQSDRRFVELLNKYNLKGSFNVSSNMCIEAEGQENPRNIKLSEIKEAYKGHEIAAHGYTHPHLDRLPLEAMSYEIYQDRITLEKASGQIVKGFVYPYGNYSKDTITALRMNGLVYARTCMGFPKYHEFDVPENWLEMDTTCHHADKRLFDLADTFINEDPLRNWHRKAGFLFSIWGHTYEFDKEEEWERIEKLMSIISNREEVWYPTTIELYRYVKAFESLEYSVDQSVIYNPSAFDIWLAKDGKPFVVPSGETVNI